jgi:hypothetical protein
MGGVSSGFKKVLGLPRNDGKPGTVADQIREPAQPASKPAEQMAAEDRSARRRARRGARALLSESRLNPEQGVTTLGQSGML